VLTQEIQAERFRIQNDNLFAKRAELKRRLAIEMATEPCDDEVLHKRTIRQLTRALEQVTTEIVELNTGLVRAYCSRFTSKGNRIDAEDFFAAGMVGLMRAIDTFDPSMGKFGSWAFKPIRREVLRAVRQADHPTVNLSDFERRPEILRAFVALKGDGDGREPTHAEVASLIGARVDQVTRVLCPPTLESVEPAEPSRGRVETLPAQQPGPDMVVMSSMTLGALREFGLGSLDDRELYVIVRRFGLDGEEAEKLADIGESLALSREAVRQIEAKALAKIQHPIILSKIQRFGRG
jgi:RNA polymerase sigma factor (sigma-70 family)